MSLLAISAPASLARLRRVADLNLLRSSAVVFTGTAVARLLAFLFYIAAARLLAPADYGLVAYTLAVVAVASMLVSTAPLGMSRFVARHAEDRTRQGAFVTNWAGFVAIALVCSTVVFLMLAPLARISGWLLLAVVVNLANIAVFETYTQLQRGLCRFVPMVGYYILTNLLQLVALGAAGLMGWRTPAVVVVIYGLSAIAAFAVVQVSMPTSLAFDASKLAWSRVRQIVRYMRPLLIQSVFYAVWWSADLILVQRFLHPAATGNYAAAKTLAQLLMLAPYAIGMSVTPYIARLPDSALRRYFSRLLAFSALAVLPLSGAVLLFARPLTLLAYGAKYPHAVDALTPLVVGVALHGLYVVTAASWGALGRPKISAFATGLGMVATVSTALLLIPHQGLVGGGIAFAAGAGLQVVAVGAYTIWGIYSGSGPRLGHLPDAALPAFESD